jgi:hypothetical protein
VIEERQVFRIGRRGGVAGSSSDWRVVVRGRVKTVDLEWLRDGLAAGRLTGIEQVRRADGDWGPLFGRPVYRQVFGATRKDGRVDGMEPRDHAKARARAAIERSARFTTGWAGLAGLLLVASLPPITGLVATLGPALTQLGLFLAAGCAVVAGLMRLRTTMARVELAALKDQLVPPVTPPPPLVEDETDEEVDWALEAARDEVDAYLASARSTTPEG